MMGGQRRIARRVPTIKEVQNKLRIETTNHDFRQVVILLQLLHSNGNSLELNLEDTARENTIFHAAAHAKPNQYTQDTMHFLLQCGVDVDRQNRKGYTPLSIAAMSSRLPNVTYLLQSGADANKQNTEGDGPLDVALARVYHNQEYDFIVEALLCHGANINNFAVWDRLQTHQLQIRVNCLQTIAIESANELARHNAFNTLKSILLHLDSNNSKAVVAKGIASVYQSYADSAVSKVDKTIYIRFAESWCDLNEKKYDQTMLQWLSQTIWGAPAKMAAHQQPPTETTSLLSSSSSTESTSYSGIT